MNHASTSAVTLSPENKESIHRLIQHVTRSFYESKVVVVFDQMLRSEIAVKDEALAAKLGVNIKDLAKIVTPLVENRLLGLYRRNEVRDGNLKAVSRAWYYLDYKTFVDAVKWRIAKIRQNIDVDTRDEIASQGYDCPICSKKFSTLDVCDLRVSFAGGFECDICGTEVVENASSAEVVQRKTKVKRLNEQIRYIAEGLKKTELITMPALDIKRWLDINHPAESSASGRVKGEDGIRIATGGAQANTVKVEMTNEAAERAIKEAKREEAEAQRAQNAQPGWFAQSTVAGGGRGIDESAENKPATSKLVEDEVATDSSALLKYYADLKAKTAELSASTSRQSSTPTIKVEFSDGDSDNDDLFDRVSTAISTPPTSVEDEKALNKPLNHNGKRSREPTPDDTTIKKRSRDNSVVELAQTSAPLVTAPDSDEDEAEFEEV